jgi:hypothetical protein
MTQHKIESVGTSAVRLTPNGVHSGMDITLQNINESGYVYIGGEGVTAESYGFRLSPNQAISFELPGSDALYAVAESELDLAVLETGLESQDG